MSLSRHRRVVTGADRLGTDFGPRCRPSGERHLAHEPGKAALAALGTSSGLAGESPRSFWDGVCSRTLACARYVGYASRDRTGGERDRTDGHTRPRLWTPPVAVHEASLVAHTRRHGHRAHTAYMEL